MPEGRDTAADRLTRLLYLLPAAADGPLSLVEAAERLGVSERTVLDDLADVTAREFYHPAGGAEDIRVEVDAGRIHVESPDKFRRPPRLSSREALATHLALRRRAASLDGPQRERVLAVAARIGTELSTAAPDEFTERFAVEESGEGGAIRLALRRAAAERRRCRIVYVRTGEGEATERALDPYAVVVAHGIWYAVGYCGLRKDVRVFRADRIVDLELTAETFEVPADFDVDEYVEGGRVFRSDAAERVTVRYTGRAAAMMRERGPAESAPDGGVLVRFDVADPGWVARHVLQQSGEAEVVEPVHVRRAVVQIAERVQDAHAPPA